MEGASAVTLDPILDELFHVCAFAAFIGEARAVGI